MSVTYSQFLKVSHQDLLSKGVYNGSLEGDSLLHIDPLLLKSCTIQEFDGAYYSFIEFFRRFIDLVPLVKTHSDSDKAFRAIHNNFIFTELPNTGLGYSQGGSKGKGVGGELSLQLTESAIEIIEIGIKRPEVFALLPLFEDNIGADRISDMTISILLKRFLLYTQRVSQELQIEVEEYHFYGETLLLPIYKHYPLIFIPMTLLTDLPHAVDFEDVGKICNYNNRLRNRLGELIGLDWVDYSKMSKPQIKKALLENPQYFNEIIDRYNLYQGIPYDFELDNKDTYQDVLLFELLQDHPLHLLQYQKDDTSEYVRSVTEAIIVQIKKLVENNYMWKIFHRRGRNPDETDWQLYIFTVADTYLKAADIDVDFSRENSVGIGNLDFKFSHGANSKTVIEVKRSGNENLLHGYVSQLPSYMKAENANHGFFVIIQESDDDADAIQEVVNKRKALIESDSYAPEVIIIDARVKDTASKQ